eukprot:TCONS_00021492-protein
MAVTHLKIEKKGAESIDEYLEYERIVGGDDKGKLFTPSQYEKYKKKMIPIRMNNRLYVCWASLKTGIECKQVGPETKCFCQHRYKQHKSDFEVLPTDRPFKLPCEELGCRCRSFSYIPRNGSQSIRCTCKHTTEEHSVVGAKKCQKTSCGCKKFYSQFTCGCGDPCSNHRMIIETKEERLSRGKPVGRDVPYKAMGGLTGFSSLADGYMRMDASGVGAPSMEILEQPSSAFDHPFLKMHDETLKGRGRGVTSSASSNEICKSTAALTLQEKEARDMDFFEQRYQERRKQEREAARKRVDKRR